MILEQIIATQLIIPIMHMLLQKSSKNSMNKGVLICGSANGVAITANKHKGIRAAICWNEKTAKLATTHNNANIICIPARFISKGDQTKILNAFFNSKFEGGRHKLRVEKNRSMWMKRQRIERHESLIHQTINEYLIREENHF